MILRKIGKYVHPGIFLTDINECLSSPCTYGSTCIDGIGEYRCICPVGRSGDRCEKVEGRIASVQSCEFNRRKYAHNASWEHECSVCKCNDGKVTCSEVSYVLFLRAMQYNVFFLLHSADEEQFKTE